MASLIEIDGTFGEGGGQILRTSLALSALTGRPFRIARIRGRRKTPGLRRQHLTGVLAARRIAAAQVEGAGLGSAHVTFRPSCVSGGQYLFDVQTAGSAMLVLQTVLPPLFLADGPSTITVRGGTHNPMGPPFDFFAESFLPAIAKMGFGASARLVRHGFFPAGGGEVVVEIEPATDPRPFDFRSPGEPVALTARVISARLPDRVWENERRALESLDLEFDAIERRDVADSRGPGNCVIIAADRGTGDRHRRSILTGFGERGKPSPVVVEEAGGWCRELIATGAAVDRFLADQLPIYLALAGGGSLTAPTATLHTTTNMAVIEKFLPVRFTEEKAGARTEIRCRLAG